MIFPNIPKPSSFRISSVGVSSLNVSIESCTLTMYPVIIPYGLVGGSQVRTIDCSLKIKYFRLVTGSDTASIQTGKWKR